MEIDPEVILADFVQVAPDDGVLTVPRGVRLEGVGPRAKSIERIARQHLDLQGPVDKLLAPRKIGARHEPIRGPLFSTLPVIADINQHNMGNCWFLSALAAIVGMGTGW